MKTILDNGTVVTMNDRRDVLDRASLLIDGNRIAAIGTSASLTALEPGAEVIDVTGAIVIPGMVNTHTHLFQTLLKGLGDDMVLKKWFTCMTGPSAAELTEADVYAAALHGCVESIRSGVTTLVDFMYAHPQPGLTPQSRRGLRGNRYARPFVCRGFITTGAEVGIPPALIETPEAALADARAQILAQNKPGGRVQVGIAPSMIWGVEESALRGTRALADETGALITTHVAETDFEIEQARARFQCTDTEYLADIGFLGPDVLAVHCVQCSRRDIRILRHHDVKVSHNPCSNMYLASGVPPIREMLASGVTVSLGSDGPASSNNLSLFQAMKFAALIQKGVHRDPTVMTADKVLEMATIDGARAVGLDGVTGSLEVGKYADIVVVGTDHPAMAPVHDPVSALVYSALGHEVTDVFIDGRAVMRGGRVTSVDESAVMALSRKAADELTTRAGTRRNVSRPWRSVAF